MSCVSDVVDRRWWVCKVCMGMLVDVCLAEFPPLCSMFRPELYWWRLVLTLRKLCEVAVALMLSSRPLFQAW